MSYNKTNDDDDDKNNQFGYLLCAVLRESHILANLILKTKRQLGRCYDLYFTVKETESQRG